MLQFLSGREELLLGGGSREEGTGGLEVSVAVEDAAVTLEAAGVGAVIQVVVWVIGAKPVFGVVEHVVVGVHVRGGCATK